MSENKKETKNTVLYVLDRLINKPVKVEGKIPTDIQAKEKIVYKDEKGKEMLGIVLGYKTKADKSGTFSYILKDTELENFNHYQETAADLYKIFKKKFTAEFPGAKPITARMSLSGRQIYFYFFAEQRFNFAEFVKSFRQEIGQHFFLYQVGARDRVRLHPHLDERYDPSGLPLMYHIFKHPLDGVESETVEAQGLYGNSDKLKDWSGKLDHTLNFEKEIYAEENKKYPRKGQIINVDGKPMKCAWFNILTQEIKLRWKIEDADENTNPRFLWKGEFKILTLDEYEKAKNKKTSTPSATKTAPPRTVHAKKPTNTISTERKSSSSQKNHWQRKKIIGHNKKIIKRSPR